MSILTDLLGLKDIIGPIIDRVLPDPVKRAEVDAELQKVLLEREASLQEAWTREFEAAVNLAVAETNRGGWYDAWRPLGSMLTLAMWTYGIFIAPFIHTVFGLDVRPDMALVFQFTMTWLGLYMGGHTLKAVAEPFANAIASRK
jgi:hypothetical protein